MKTQWNILGNVRITLTLKVVSIHKPWFSLPYAIIEVPTGKGGQELERMKVYPSDLLSLTDNVVLDNSQGKHES